MQRREAGYDGAVSVRAERKSVEQVCGARETVFDVADVADEQVTDGDLLDLTGTQRRELVLVLDLALQAAELPLLAPVVERRHQYHHQHGHQDRHALNP